MVRRCGSHESHSFFFVFKADSPANESSREFRGDQLFITKANTENLFKNTVKILDLERTEDDDIEGP